MNSPSVGRRNSNLTKNCLRIIESMSFKSDVSNSAPTAGKRVLVQPEVYAELAENGERSVSQVSRLEYGT